MLQELEKQELKEVRFTIDVNLMGTFHFIKAPLSRMRHWKEAWTNVDRHYIIVGQSGTMYLNKCDVFSEILFQKFNVLPSALNFRFVIL